MRGGRTGPAPTEVSSARIVEILAEAKRLAKEYRALTGRPLGITGEVAEYEVARILDLELCAARQAGYDAIRRQGRRIKRLQIKGRCVLDQSTSGQQLGRIRLDKEWDAVLVVLMDADFEAIAIYEADRETVEEALNLPGSRARERGVLSVSRFKAISQLVWSRKLAG